MTKEDNELIKNCIDLSIGTIGSQIANTKDAEIRNSQRDSLEKLIILHKKISDESKDK